MAPEFARRPFPAGTRGGVLILLVLAATWGWWHLGLSLADLVPGGTGLRIAREFFAAALAPALSYQGDWVAADAPPLLLRALEAAGTTIVFALAAMSLALLAALLLGFLASTAWWAGDPAGSPSRLGRLMRRSLLPALYLGARTLIAVLRSIHELLWALLFLVAFGLSDVAAVLAIALPYSGYLAKIFSEVVDEAPREGAEALRAAGAGGLQVFAFGLVLRALPDMVAYGLYRFECALRSSAILGFFGYPTIGLFIRQSFLSGHYREVWTYLYVLIAIVLLFDWWSGAVRRRMVA